MNPVDSSPLQCEAPRGWRADFLFVSFHVLLALGQLTRVYVYGLLVDLMRWGLPSCVLHREVGRFFSDINGDESTLAILCVLVAHASGDLLLRIDLGWFNMVDDDVLPADVKAVVNLIYYSSF